MAQLQDMYEDNYPAAVLSLGALVMLVNYKSLFNDGEYNVPAIYVVAMITFCTANPLQRRQLSQCLGYKTTIS